MELGTPTDSNVCLRELPGNFGGTIMSDEQILKQDTLHFKQDHSSLIRLSQI